MSASPLWRFFVVVVLAVPVAGQSLSPIGNYLAPWGCYETNPIAMTSDAAWVAFVEAGWGCTSVTPHRISMIRGDGTDYQVILGTYDLGLLRPWQSSATFIEDLRISGDGNTLFFWWNHWYTSCGGTGSHYYLVDVPTKSAVEFFFNGQQAGNVTFTDDDRMVFKGYDPTMDAYSYWLSKTDLSDPVRILDPSSWYGSFGMISGDGSTLLVIVYHGGYPFPSDVYVLDIATNRLVRVNPTTLDQIYGGSLSRDGSRVVYSHNLSPTIFAVASDGSDYHEIPVPFLPGDRATITRDGEYIFFGVMGGQDPTGFGACYRMEWDGSDLGVVSQYALGTEILNNVPVNADGTLVPHWSSLAGPARPLTLAILDPPMLTTYGIPAPGGTLAWDVAGHPGDTYLLAWSLTPASLPLEPYGTLGLDPATLQLLSAGTISGPKNVGQLRLALRPELAAVGPFSAYFQALVLGHQGSALTNRTEVVFDLAVPAATGADSGARQPTTPAWAPLPPPELTPQERFERLLAADPAHEWRLQRAATRGQR